jgi:serine/threonine-protein kinase
LELVAGETLAEKIERSGPGIPIDDALPIFMQIAGALDAAHENGIIHRDLKPANIKVTPKGQAKVLDFGLAKPLPQVASADDLSQSPTVARDGTLAGVILGTAAYMSPEQARGKPVDKCTDIWSFGCVLYEALSGKKAFIGETLSDTIAAVLKQDIDWRALPESTPPTLRRLLRGCVQKDPEKRFRDAWDIRVELEEALAEEPVPVTEGKLEPPAVWRRLLPWCVALVVAAVAIWSSMRPTPSALQPVARFVLDTPEEGLSQTLGSRVEVSSDGSHLAYVGGKIYLRTLDDASVEPIPGTEGARGTLCFSPDSRWLAFFDDGKLKKVSVLGGTPQVICDAPKGSGVTWGPDDTIVFSPAHSSGLYRVSASGGEPEPVTRSETGASFHWYPQFLPDGETILFTQIGGGNINIEALFLETGERKVLFKGGSHARYSPSGHLLFMQLGTLLAAPFDVEALEVTGPPVPIIEGVMFARLNGSGFFSFSRDGTLFYVSGGAKDESSLVEVDRKGSARVLLERKGRFMYPRLSPDGQRIALGILEGVDPGVWVYDIVRGTLVAVEKSAQAAIWTPDGARVTYANASGSSVSWKAADGSGVSEPFLEPHYPTYPNSWSPDGSLLACTQLTADAGLDIGVLLLEGKATPIAKSSREERTLMFSPDGRWIAYVSDETGRLEVYVRPYPDLSEKHQISIEGGTQPVWARDGKGLFYVSGDKLMFVAIRTSPSFSPSKPEVVFERPIFLGGQLGLPGYDVSADGQRFYMVDVERFPTRMNVVLNWFQELKRLVPVE